MKQYKQKIQNPLFRVVCNLCGYNKCTILPSVQYQEDYKTPSKMIMRLYCPNCNNEHEILIYE